MIGWMESPPGISEVLSGNVINGEDKSNNLYDCAMLIIGGDKQP